MKFRLFDIENWQEIGATLSRNKTRTFLTAFGIFWGTAMLAMLWGGAQGLEGMMRRNFEGFATNMGAAFPSTTTMSYRGFNKGMSWSMIDADLDYLRRSCPFLDLSTGMYTTGASIKYDTKSSTSRAIGVDADYFKIQLPVVSAGRVINESDVSLSRKVIDLGANVAADLFEGQDPIGKYVEVNGIYFMVVGVVSQKSDVSMGGRLDDAVVVPLSTMRQAFNTGDDIGSLIYTAKAGYTPKQIEPYLWRAVQSNHPLNPEDRNCMWIMDVSEQFSMVDKVFLGINLLALFVGIGTLLAGVIGIGNIMWIIVKERTKEIGIRRAIGAKPRDIILQVLSESMVLTAVAGLLGICFAAAALHVADMLTYDPLMGSAHFELSISRAIVIAITFLVLGTAAGVIPALKAMRIKPIEALNDK